MAKRPRKTGQQAEEHRVRSIDDLSRLEWIDENMARRLQADLAKGLTAEEIETKYAPLIKSMLVTTALFDRNATSRISAAKDVLDRTEGKAKETKEITHRMKDLPEEQLDALIESKQQELDDLEDETTH